MPKEINQDKKKVPTKSENKPNRDPLDRYFYDDVLAETSSFFKNPRMLALLNRNWFPRVDISETNDEVKVIADVPGVDPKDINIDIRDRTLTISGTIERESKNERPYRYERTYGEFRRELTLPARVKEDQIKAICKEGVLSVTLPKTEEEKRKRITIEQE